MDSKKNDLKRISPFVKYYIGLSYLFSPSEARFIMHMINFEYLKQHGYSTNWSKKDYILRMGLSKNAFNTCVKKFVEMKLLKKWNNDLGNKVFYSFDLQLYEKLIDILSSTNNVPELISFCQSTFKQGRLIEDITEEEVLNLKRTCIISKEKSFLGFSKDDQEK